MKNLGIIPLEIYTDGSCKSIGKQTFGAWAYIIVRDGKIIATDAKGYLNTTNQRMELLGAAEALKIAEQIKQPYEKIILYSDSAYFINCFKQRWYDNWQRNGWVNSKGQDVANQDIWSEIVPFFEKIEYSFEKVKGHAGDVYNEKCDKLAQFTADQEKARWRGKLNE